MVSLGGCTASFVSRAGLVVTKPPLRDKAIQLNSTPENNSSKTQLSPARCRGSSAGGARIYVTVGFDKITDRILADARGQDRARVFRCGGCGEVRWRAVRGRCWHRCSVADMYHGSEFYPIKQLE